MNPYEPKRRETQRLQSVVEHSRPPFVVHVHPYIVFFHEFLDIIEVSVYTKGGSLVKEEVITSEHLIGVSLLTMYYDWYANKIAGEMTK